MARNDLWKPPPEVRAALERGRRKIARAKIRAGRIPPELSGKKGVDLEDALTDYERLEDARAAQAAEKDILTWDRSDEENESVVLRDGKDAAYRLSPTARRLRAVGPPGPRDALDPGQLAVRKSAE